MRFVTVGTMPGMSGTSRAAGYVLLTSAAAVLEIIRRGWREETRAEDEPEPAEAA